jgi:2-polyprenyl-3-methyl-5-hydroxy-6-metoxy-1,4-benzoquinol methylase
LGNVQFRNVNVQDWIEETQYDCIYCRFLLTHLADPTLVVRQMLQAVRPGGVAIVEDIDFGGHFCHPQCAGFDAYVRLYRAASDGKEPTRTSGQSSTECCSMRGGET